MSLGPYIAGWTVVALLAVSALVFSHFSRRVLGLSGSGPLAWLEHLLLVAFVLLMGGEIAGTIGVFGVPGLIAAVSLLALAAGLLARRRGRAEGLEPHAPMRPSSRAVRIVLIVVGVGVSALVFVRFGVATAGSYGSGMTGFDTNWYHGPFSALMVQTGSTFELFRIAPQYLSWFYPLNSELFHAIGIASFDRDILSPSVNMVWMAATMLACWCIGRPYGVAPVALLAGSLVLGSGMLTDQAGEARNDLPAVFFVTAAIAIYVNRIGTVREHPGTVIAIALACGMAAGTKLNYLAIAGAMLLTVAAIWPAGRRVQALALGLVGAFVAGGYWYVRNAVLAGNPLPWITSAGPFDLPGPDQEIGGREPHGVIEYVFDGAVWQEWLMPGLRETLTNFWPVVAGLLALSLLLMVSGRRAERGLAVVLAAGIGAWLFAPASAEGPAGEPVGFESGLRYLAPVLVIGLALLPGLVATRAPRIRGQMQVAAAGLRLPRRVLIGVGSAVLAFAVVVVGYPVQRHYMDSRYAEVELSSKGLAQAFEWAHDRSGLDVVTNTTRQYPLFGPELENSVQFAGIETPHGGMIRPAGCESWRQAVTASGAELVLVAWDRQEGMGPALPPEAAWTRSSPGAAIAESFNGARLFRLRGPLRPADCPGGR